MKSYPGIPCGRTSPASRWVADRFIRWWLLIIFVLFSSFWLPQPLTLIASTGALQPFREGQLVISQHDDPNDFPSLMEFITAVRNGDETAVRGVYVPGLFALPVIPQPDGDFGFVSINPETLTEFQLADENHVIGLLAHNYLSGKQFFKLTDGQRVIIIKGDGTHRTYLVSGSYRFQKLDPESDTSKYIDLSTGKSLSTRQLFNRFYSGGPHVTFQTCLEREGNLVWGLLFVVAVPLELPQ